MNTTQFQVGQRVRIAANDLLGTKEVWISPSPTEVGKVGVITHINDFYCPSMHPDVTVEVEGQDTWIQVDVCFLVPEAAPQAKPVATRAGAGKLSPQCTLLINHLKNGWSLTQRSALMDFGVMALPRRIADLKERGYRILSQLEVNKLTGQRYARYSLAA